MKILNFKSIMAAVTIMSGCAAMAQNQYGLPADIKDGNILHCFDWTMNDVKAELPKIAEAGFNAVQLSPLQRNSSVGHNWSDPYRPYDFKFVASGFGTATDLQNLCSEAEKYGISVIVDVVFNHVDKGSYHDPWWNATGRLRTGTAYINYSNRNSITQDKMGDYSEVNSEDADVIARAKAYIEELKSYGVKGIRFDAAKHIALPSEKGNFWKEVTSVPGMFYYGEILESPGGSNAVNLMKEYAQYMSVTDDHYSTTVRNNSGVAPADGNWTQKGVDGKKLIYWGESHDTYSNTPEYGGVTKNLDQGRIDKAYAILACRNLGTGLYFSRPGATDFGSIRVGQKGSTHFTKREVAEINKFKNAMVGKADSYSQTGAVASVTRQNGGAVIVSKGGAGNVSVPNGNGYCPAGKYYDRISGNEFTVTASTITGKVGATGIAVIYGDFVPGPDFDFDDSEGNDEGSVYVYCSNPEGWENVYVYMYSSQGAAYTNAGWPGEKMTPKGTLWEYEVPASLWYNARVIFNNGKNSGQYPGKVDSTSEDGYLLNGHTMLSDGTGNDNWKEYSYKEAGIGGIEADEEFDLSEASWFTLQGVRVVEPSAKGVYIAVSPKGHTKKIMVK